MKKQDLSYCRRCGSEKLVKQGKVFNAMKITWRQQYLCKHCAHKFLGIELHMADSYAPPAFKYQDQPLPKIDWVAYNQAQLNEKTLFLELLNGVLGLFVFEDIVRVGRPTGNVRDILYSMVLKAYLKNSSRRAVSDLKILQDLHFVEKVP
ncbi:MAG: hypothetical protein NTY48_02120, partial [Candidatus Diapherotrites archaeon]|nr:hypothetical protein [Candidatus Diapherotrites archaeon]